MAFRGVLDNDTNMNCLSDFVGALYEDVFCICYFKGSIQCMIALCNPGQAD